MADSARIAFFGSSLVSAYWNGAATYYRGIIRALDACGVRTTFFEPDAFDRQAHRDMEDPSWARSVVYPATEAGVRQALEQAHEADFVIKASGVGVFDDLLEQEVARLASPARAVLFWDVDAPATLARLTAAPDDPFHSLVPQYDAVLTYGGGERVLQAYRKLGAKHCESVYNAVDPDIHHPVGAEPRFEGLLGFLGNRLPDRDARVREFFFEPARRLPQAGFVLGGSGWEDADVPVNVRPVGHVYSRDHNAFNCSPRAVININRDSMAVTGHSPPTRVFEAAGAGACLLCDDWPGLEDFLEPGVEVIIVSGADDVVRELEQLEPGRAERIGAAARRRVLAAHTYTHRATQIQAMLEGVAPGSRGFPAQGKAIGATA
ncbi:glycosyltransferase [soil metagenome]